MPKCSVIAIGCQYAIAEKIVSKKADYVFSLKGSQGKLREAAEEYWEGLDFNTPASEQDRYIRFNSSSTYVQSTDGKNTGIMR